MFGTCTPLLGTWWLGSRGQLPGLAAKGELEVSEIEVMVFESRSGGSTYLEEDAGCQRWIREV